MTLLYHKITRFNIPLYLYGHTKAAVIENIFAYDNSLQVFDYSDLSADAE